MKYTDMCNSFGTTGLLLAFCSVAFCLPDTATAQDFTDEKLKKFLVGGFNVCRESLVSGECRVELTGSKLSAPTKCHLLFDIAAGNWRFDAVDENVESQFIQSPEFSYSYVIDGGTVEKGNPIPERDRPSTFPFDPRLVGMTNSALISHRFSYDVLRLDQPHHICILIKKIGEGEYDVTFSKADVQDGEEIGKLIYEYQVRSDRGFTPVQLVESYLPVGETTPEKMSQVNTTWEQRGEVWVPLVALYKDLQNGGDLRLAFEWQSVNEPIPSKRFDYHDFYLPDGTLIVDIRLGGAGIIIETIGAKSESQPTRTGFWRIAVIVIVIIVGAAGIVVLLRRSPRVSAK